MTRLPIRLLTSMKAAWFAAVALLEALLLGGLALTDGASLDGGVVFAVVGAHLLVGLAFVGGARTERRRGTYRRLERWLDERSARTPWAERAVSGHRAAEPVGDVTLEQAVLALTPPHPRLMAVRDADALARWQEEARRSLCTLHGVAATAAPAPPERSLAGFRRLGVTPLADGVTRVAITTRGADGTRIPGYLFEHAPTGAPRPAVLVIPGHGRGIASTAGTVRSYEQGIAARFARAGYVALTLELRGFGLLGERIGVHHETVALNALLAGSSYHSFLVRDLLAGLRALAQHPGVDPERVGVTGCSLGGNLALSVGALAPWVRAVVAQGLVDWPDNGGRRPPLRADLPHLAADPCWVVPNENAHSWYEDRWLLIAPRPMLLVNAWQDVGDMDVRGSWLLDRLRGAYAACGAARAFDFRVERGHHSYFVEPALAFLDVHLRGEEAADAVRPPRPARSRSTGTPGRA